MEGDHQSMEQNPWPSLRPATVEPVDAAATTTRPPWATTPVASTASAAASPSATASSASATPSSSAATAAGAGGKGEAEALNAVLTLEDKLGVKADAIMDTATDEGEDTDASIDRSIHKSGIVPRLQNIVSSVKLGCRLDLKHIAMNARNAEYNPKRYAAVIMRIRDPKTTALIFASGKIVVTGAKTEDASKLAARKYARIIQKLGHTGVKFLNFAVHNVVASTDVRFPIRLEGLAHKHKMFCSYEPELFPGIIYRLVRPKMVLLVFVSGKVVLTGAKSRDDIYKGFEIMYPVFKEFKKE